MTLKGFFLNEGLQLLPIFFFFGKEDLAYVEAGFGMRRENVTG
jgi:hypothetical protein